MPSKASRPWILILVSRGWERKTSRLFMRPCGLADGVCCSCALQENLVQMAARAIADEETSLAAPPLPHPARQSDVRGPPLPLTGSIAGNGTRAMRAIISGVGAPRHKSALWPGG